MFFRRMVPFLLTVSLASVACSLEREPVEAFKPNPLDRATKARQQDAFMEREQARRDFIAARKDFVDALAFVMTTEQLAARAREVSAEMRLERAQKRLTQVRSSLRDVRGDERGDSDEARRLTERAVTLEAQVTSLRVLDSSISEQNEDIVTKVIVGQFQQEMADETEYLADVLETSELNSKAAQLRQMAKLGDIATGLKALNDDPALTQDEPPEIGTAKGGVTPKADVEAVD